MKWSAGWWDAVNRTVVVALVVWIGFDAMGKNVFGRTPWPNTMIDYQIIYRFSKIVVETQTYPEQHSHPPAAVALQYGLAQFDFPLSAALYLASNIVAALACWWVLARLLGIHRRRDWGVLVLLAHVAASYFFNWELRSQNCNLHFLLALLLSARFVTRERPRAAGFCLALSFSLKLFSVLVIPYLLWKRQYRAFAWTVAFLVMFWVLIPGAVFGPTNVIPVYRAWLQKLERNASDKADLHHPILISLRNSAHVLTGGDQRKEDRIVNGVWLAWLAVGLVGWWATHTRPQSPRDAFGLLADVSLLTLGPIAVSPYLEPYHAIVFAIPAMLYLHAATDPQLARHWRRFAGGLFVVTGVGLSLIPIPWHVRGLWLNGFLIVAMGGIVALARLRRSAAGVVPQTTPLEAPRRAA